MMKKTIFKKTASLILALLTIVSTLVILPLSASAETPLGWGDSDAATNTYYIATAADMKTFQETTAAQGVNAKVYLTADIDMSEVTGWAPLASFAGTFDGQGHTVKNMSNTTGVNNGGAFIKLFDGATLQNVIFDNISYVVTSGVFDRMALITGHVYDNNNDGKTSTFKNVTVINGTLSVTVTDKSKNGGFVGQVSAPASFENCVVSNTTLSGRQQVSGFVGYAKATGTVSFKNCYSDCTVNTKSGYTAGFVGYAEKSTFIIENCVVTGSYTGATYVGGFIGYIHTDVTSVTISDSVFIGTIDCASNYAAGFVGNAAKAFTLTRCISLGTVKGDATTKAEVAYMNADTVTATLTDCLSRDQAGLDTIANAASGVATQVGALNYTKDNFKTNYPTFDKWVVTDDSITPVGSAASYAVVLPEGMDAVVDLCPIPTTDIYYQKKANDNGTVDIRFVAVVNDLRYANVGFNIQATRNDGTNAPETSAVITKSTTTVYQSVTALGEAVTAASLNGNYIFVIEIQNVDAATYAHNFDISAFVTMQDGTVVTAATQTATVDKAA